MKGRHIPREAIREILILMREMMKTAKESFLGKVLQ